MIRLKKYLFTCFLLCLSTINLLSQTAVLDSLKLGLRDAKSDTTRCSILLALAENNVNENWNEKIALTKLSLILTERNLANEKITGNNRLVYLKYYSAALNNLGYLNQYLGNITEGIQYYTKSIAGYKQIKDKVGEANAYNNLGYVYDNQGNIANALSFYFKSLKLNEEVDYKQGIVTALINIGSVYKKHGNINKATEYFERGLKISNELKDNARIALSLSHLAAIYRTNGNKREALDYNKESIQIHLKNGDKIGLAMDYYGLGQTYSKFGDLEFGLDYYKKGLGLFEEKRDNRGIINCLQCIARIYFDKNEYNQAKTFATNALTLSEEMGYPENTMTNSKLLYELYKKQNSAKESLKMYMLYIQMKDSLFSQQNKRASVNSLLKYEYEKKAIADSIRVFEEKKISTLKIKNTATQRNYLLGGLGLTLLFAIFMFNRLRVTKKQKEIIEGQKEIVEKQKNMVEQKQREVLDSIRYAKRMQNALLPQDLYVERCLTKLNKN